MEASELVESTRPFQRDTDQKIDWGDSNRDGPKMVRYKVKDVRERSKNIEGPKTVKALDRPKFARNITSKRPINGAQKETRTEPDRKTDGVWDGAPILHIEAHGEKIDLFARQIDAEARISKS